jgi:hypothetical protein
MNDQHANIEAIRRADAATIVRSYVEGMVSELIKTHVHTLVAHYRGGDLKHDMLVGKVGEMSALIGLIDLLEGSQRAGESAREREFNGPDDDASEEAELERLAEEDETPKPPSVTVESIQRDMLAMERRHAEEMAAIRRQNPPPREAPTPSTSSEELSQLLFNDPKAAIAKIREEVGQEIETKLTRKYTSDQNTQKFWNAFDDKFPDLKGDRDLVEMTMNANLSTLANIPVEDAMDRIAELTRNRIARYTKSRPKGPRPFAEGASPPMPPRQQEEEEKPPSLSDIVRRRRAAKQNRASVA